MKFISTILKAVLVAYLIIFAVVNSNQTEIQLFFNSTPIVMPTFLFTIICIFVGLVAGSLMMLTDHFSLSKQVKKLNKTIASYDQEIVRLKNLTISDTELPVKKEPKKSTAKPVETDVKKEETNG